MRDDIHTRSGEIRQLARLAAPIAIAQAGTQLMSVVDAAVVGRVGAVELAATGLGASMFFAYLIIGMGIVMGIDPLVAQAFGARNPAAARRLMWQGMWLASGVSVVVCLLMLTGPWLLSHVGVEPRVRNLAWTYLAIRMGNVAPYLWFLVARSYLQAAHVTRSMVLAMVVGNVFNFFADVVLVFGGSVLPEWTGPLHAIPAMGVAGAAVASVLSGFLQFGILAWAMRSVDAGGAFRRRPLRPDLVLSIRIGLPVGLQMGAEFGVFAFVGLLAGRMGAVPLAAHQLALTIAAFTFTIAMGVGAAGAVQVGRAIGAGNAERTRREGLLAFLLGGGVMVASAVAFLIAPEMIARIVTDQPAVIAAAVPLLAVAAFFQISDGIQAVGSGVLRGAGDTRFAFLANVVCHWGIGLPVALYLGFELGWGVRGLWWGLCAGLTAVAALLVWRFLRIARAPIAAVFAGTPQPEEE